MQDHELVLLRSDLCSLGKMVQHMQQNCCKCQQPVEVKDTSAYNLVALTTYVACLSGTPACCKCCSFQTAYTPLTLLLHLIYRTPAACPLFQTLSAYFRASLQGLMGRCHHIL